MGLLIFALYMTITAYIFCRLVWIKRFQMVVLMRSPMIYMSLPPLKHMLWKKWWLWEETAFLPNPEDLRGE